MSIKLDLKVLKNVLIIEDDGGCDDINREINEWVKDNIGEGEVSVKEWLDEFSKYWSEWSDDYGDSVMIMEILVNDYELSNDEIDEIMCVYWKCDSIEEYREYYDNDYSVYKYREIKF